MKEYIEKEISFERALFFSDAIVAIAITLLALDLKLNVSKGHQLTFKDLLLPWQTTWLSFYPLSILWASDAPITIFLSS